jgi:hypothetical protein
MGSFDEAPAIAPGPSGAAIRGGTVDFTDIRLDTGAIGPEVDNFKFEGSFEFVLPPGPNGGGELGREVGDRLFENMGKVLPAGGRQLDRTHPSPEQVRSMPILRTF